MPNGFGGWTPRTAEAQHRTLLLATRNGAPWTAEDDELIRKCDGTIDGLEDVALQLKRSWSACQNRFFGTLRLGPRYRVGETHGSAVNDSPRMSCPGCFIELPRTGVCDCGGKA